MLKKIIFLFFCIILSSQASAAVILQYHHVGSTTPRSTSVTTEELRAHLNWLKENNFEIIDLPQLVMLIKNKKLDENKKIASITFDDISQSICNEAWPILEEYQIPFTLFINTNMLPNSAQADIATTKSGCSWQALKIMQKSGLLTVGNHSHSHPQMLLNEYSLPTLSVKNKNEIVIAQERIDEALGKQEKLFAYPYGEYSQKTQELVKQLAYVGFGQQSGAIGNNSDLSALPRFSMSGQYANIKTISDKLLSLPFPLKTIHVDKNPIKGKNPNLELIFQDDFLPLIQCYLGNGQTIDTKQNAESVKAHYVGRLASGRVRYNCTASSTQKGRFYWFSYQWLYQE